MIKVGKKKDPRDCFINYKRSRIKSTKNIDCALDLALTRQYGMLCSFLQQISEKSEKIHICACVDSLFLIFIYFFGLISDQVMVFFFILSTSKRFKMVSLSQFQHSDLVCADDLFCLMHDC